MHDLTQLRNLGPKSKTMLADIGVTTRTQLAELGSIGAYHLLRAQGYPVSLNLVYAIEGALMDMDWRDLPDELRQRLREQIAS